MPEVSAEAANAYQDCLETLIRDVNHAMVSRKDLARLIGDGQSAVMFQNHKHHGNFMATVFQLNAFELMAKTIPWVYRVYLARRFTAEYFQEVIPCFEAAVGENLPASEAGQINRVYAWMRQHHSVFLELAETGPPGSPRVPAAFAVKQSAFQEHALSGDHRACLSIAAQITEASDGVEDLYLHVIQPTMENIGLLWEKNRISVADEHLASAVVGRVLTQISLLENGNTPPRHTAIVACVSKESHELGAWMMADLLERNGWDVRFLGANTPSDAVVQLVEKTEPDLLMLSVTLFQHIPEAANLIRMLRRTFPPEQLKIMVGGQAFRNMDTLWGKTGADGFAVDPIGALNMLAAWFAL